MAGVDVDRLVAIGNGAVVLALLAECPGAIDVEAGIVRRERDRARIVHDGSIEVSLVLPGNAAIGKSAHVSRIERDHLGHIGDDMIDIVLLGVGQTAHEIGVHAQIGDLVFVLGNSRASGDLLVGADLAVAETGSIILAGGVCRTAHSARHHNPREGQRQRQQRHAQKPCNKCGRQRVGLA